MLWVESFVSWSVPCEVHGDDEEHLGCDVQTDGVQPISRIEVDITDLRESSTRGMGFGYRESLEGPFWPQTRIENDRRDE